LIYFFSNSCSLFYYVSVCIAVKLSLHTIVFI